MKQWVSFGSVGLCELDLRRCSSWAAWLVCLSALRGVRVALALVPFFPFPRGPKCVLKSTIGAPNLIISVAAAAASRSPLVQPPAAASQAFPLATAAAGRPSFWSIFGLIYRPFRSQAPGALSRRRRRCHHYNNHAANVSFLAIQSVCSAADRAT